MIESLGQIQMESQFFFILWKLINDQSVNVLIIKDVDSIIGRKLGVKVLSMQILQQIVGRGKCVWLFLIEDICSVISVEVVGMNRNMRERM